MVVAYVRVSTEKQDLDNQKKEIERYVDNRGITVDQWVEEVVSGTVKKENRQLDKVLSQLQKGDTLIITEISRLSRSLLEILSTMEECVKEGVMVLSVKDGYTFDQSINSTVLIFAFGLISEVERKLISMRTREALISRKQAGIVLGRPYGSRPMRNKLLGQKKQIEEMLEQGAKIKYICALYGVSRNTFERFRAEYLTEASI